MKESLLSKIKLLPINDISYYYDKLYNILNDCYSCFVYGGMDRDEYATLPREKVEKVEEKLYEEISKGKASLSLS